MAVVVVVVVDLEVVQTQSLLDVAVEEDVQEALEALRLAEEAWRAARELVLMGGGDGSDSGGAVQEDALALNVAAAALARARDAHAASGASFARFLVAFRPLLQEMESS